MRFTKGHVGHNKGGKLSDEQKEKVRRGITRWHKDMSAEKKLAMRQKQSKAKKERPTNFWKGKHFPEDAKKKMSLSHVGIQAGERHPNWMGGKSFEPYSVEFNEQLKEHIRKKYGYRCQQCFRHQDELFNPSGRRYKLNIHHIDYNKKNNSENNLIPLCRNCHAQTNFGREDWINYFASKTSEV